MQRNPIAGFHLVAVLACAGCAPGLIGEDVPLDLDPQVIPGDATAHAAALALEQSGAATLPVLSVVTDRTAVDSGPASQIYLRSATVDIQSPADGASGSGCWDFVRGVSVYLESTVQGSELPRVEIAHATAPGCVTSLPLTPDGDINLQPYTSKAFRLTLEATGIPPAVDVTIVTHLVVRAAIL